MYHSDYNVHPVYYAGFDELLDKLFNNEQLIDIAEFNIWKYLYRWRHKNGVEDLKKARTYLDSMINRLECNNNKCINTNQQHIRDIECNP